MEIKRSDIKLEKFTMLACDFRTVPSEKKLSCEALKNIPIDLDFNILTHKNNKSKIKIILELNSNVEETPQPGYIFTIISEAEYNIKGLAKMDDSTKNRCILFTALPLAIAMVRSHLYSVSGNFTHGHYMLPSIDLPDLFSKKFENK